MTLLLHPFQSVTTKFYIILFWQISQVLALPTNIDQHTGGLAERDITAPNLSGAAAKIGGGVFALILLSLGFGLGAASIAIAGSPEWREFRDRKKPKVPAKEGMTAATQEDEEKGAQRVQTGLSASTVDEKEKPIVEPVRRARLTLKSFVPIDFNDLRPGWLMDARKT